MSTNSLGLVSWIATLVSDIGSPTPTLVASILGFLLALIGRHLLGRAALRWWLALRGAPPDQRAEIIRALTRQSPTRSEAGADQRRRKR